VEDLSLIDDSDDGWIARVGDHRPKISLLRTDGDHRGNIALSGPTDLTNIAGGDGETAYVSIRRLSPISRVYMKWPRANSFQCHAYGTFPG